MAAKKHSSLDRVLGRLDTLDSVNLANLVQRLARERGDFEAIFNTLQEGILVVRDDGAIEYGKGRSPRASEMRRDLELPMRKLFTKYEEELPPESSWLGQPIRERQGFRFRAPSADGLIWQGEAYTVQTRGMAYFWLNWCSEGDFDAMKDEFTKCRSRFQLLDDRKDWRESVPKEIDYKGATVPYTFGDAEDIWVEQKDTDVEPYKKLNPDLDRWLRINHTPRTDRRALSDDADLRVYLLDGTLLNRPFDRAGTPLRQGLLVRYDGVYAPPVSLPVVGSTNRAQGERIRYKIVRPSTVTATVIGPDGVARAVDGGTRQPGVYGFTWRSIDQEGTWHWNVKATDDLGRASTADRTFRYDLTLGALSVAGPARVPVRVSFTLARSASVTLRIETASGAVVTTSAPTTFESGPQSLAWDGTASTGAAAPAALYVARVIATSSTGTSDLTARFRLRR